MNSSQQTGPQTRFCQLCATEEGFFKPDTLPARDNNPLDLRHSPHSQHSPDAPNAVGQIDTVADGWADAERQAQLWAERGLTLQKAIENYLAPPNENDSAGYLAFVLDGFHGAVTAATLMSDVLKIPAE